MEGLTAPRPTLRFRSVFISDVHLGFKGCRAEFLLDFLRRVECQQIYLVGDIIDLWSLARSFYWPQAHNDVIRTILGKAKHGTRVICGHIHRAEISEIEGITYCNDGDWVESRTTLAEDYHGRLSLLRWTETVEVLVGSQALPLMEGAVALEPAA